MWQSKRDISRECNDIIGSAKGSQISEKYWGEVGKGKRADVYLEVRKRRGHIFFEWNKSLWLALWNSNSACWSRTKWISSSSSWKLICFRHYIADKFMIDLKQQSLTHSINSNDPPPSPSLRSSSLSPPLDLIPRPLLNPPPFLTFRPSPLSV